MKSSAFDEWRDTARRVLTEKQYEAIELRELGLSLRVIADALDISLSTTVDRLKRADKLMVLEQQRQWREKAGGPVGNEKNERASGTRARSPRNKLLGGELPTCVTRAEADST